MIKTTSLETSKLLKEAGFRQDSEESWEIVPKNGIIKESRPFITRHPNHDHSFSAPTTDELLEQLPADLYEDGYCYTLTIYKNLDNTFCVSYAHHAGELKDKIIDDLELPEALAQMWLWLKKEGLI